MRFLCEFSKEDEAQAFSLFLQSKGVQNSVDTSFKEETIFYQIWVHDEDKMDEAQKYFKKFSKNPKNFNVVEDSNKVKGKKERKKSSFPITFFILGLCIFIYLINLFQEMSIRKENPSRKYILFTPVQHALLYDVPYLLMQVDKWIEKYNIDPTKSIQSKKAQEELKKIEKAPFWRGFYEMVVSKDEKIEGVLFEKIRKGQIWRLFTPCILHTWFLHILFNMLWLWVLGKQIEGRLCKYKYILLILITGIVSNTFQYLMSGPYFLGYSGVVMGMVGFIWSRQKKAPWEGYPLQKSVFVFLTGYVALMFILSFFSFVTQTFGRGMFSPNIANTAHIVGGIVGWLLGRFSFFSWEKP